MTTDHAVGTAPAAGASLELPAPAKINRFLRVLGRRADGYHELETLFQFLELADTLRFEASAKPRIERIDRHDFELPEADLCLRAALLLQETAPETARRGVTITLKKTIPPGSGLGGGSSNAATTLLALNHLWQLGLSRARLAALGLQLGADVPVFVHGLAARGRGVGEALTACNPTEQWLCLCLPPVSVSTARVFSRFRPEAADPNAAGRGNDLEPVTAALYPEVANALAVMRRHADARLSGSGAAVYAAFDAHARAMGMMHKARAARLPGVRILVTRAVNRHPLVDFPPPLVDFPGEAPPT